MKLHALTFAIFSLYFSVIKANELNASEISRETYIVGTSKIPFVSIAVWHWTISENCLPLQGLQKKYFNCQAALALQKNANIKIKIRGGQNPGALICKEVGGEVIYALINNNQITLCKFKDGTMASNGSLAYAHFR